MNQLTKYILCFLFISISGYSQSIPEIITEFKNNKVQNANGLYYYEYENENELVRIEDHNPFYVVKINSKNNFSKTLVVSKKSNNILKKKIYFLTMPYGYETEYDEDGKIISKVNNEEDFAFTIDQLIDKVKRDFNIDITTPMKGLLFRKSIAGDPPLYHLYIPTYEGSEEKRVLLFDGNTGRLLKENTGFFEK